MKTPRILICSVDYILLDMYALALLYFIVYDGLILILFSKKSQNIFNKFYVLMFVRCQLCFVIIKTFLAKENLYSSVMSAQMLNTLWYETIFCRIDVLVNVLHMFTWFYPQTVLELEVRIYKYCVLCVQVIIDLGHAFFLRVFWNGLLHF